MSHEDKISREDAPQDDLVYHKADNKKERKKLAGHAGYHGDFEVDAAKHGRALFSPLAVSDEAKRTVPGLASFTELYDIYKIPVHQAQLAVGRVNDLYEAGAPRTPAEIKPGLMRYFHRVDNVSDRTSEKIKATDANQWIEQQDELNADFSSFMQAREAMQGAMAEFRSTQWILYQRKLAAKRADDEDQKEKIDQCAETLAKITEVSAEALSATSLLEGEFMDVEETYTQTAEEGVQTAEVARKGKTEKLKEVVKAGGGEVGLKGIFIWLTGNSAKYTQLKADIEKLNGQIRKAGVNEQNERINAAWDKLDNVKLQIKGTQRAFSAKKGDTRNAAQAFGQALGGGEKTIMVTMMASAYQEMDLFGSRAIVELNKLYPKAKSVWGYLEGTEEKARVEMEDPFPDQFAQDWQAMGNAVLDVQNSKELLENEVPKWQEAASAWRHFFSDVMGKSFDSTEADVDQEGKG
jgi:hypothetical protein